MTPEIHPDRRRNGGGNGWPQEQPWLSERHRSFADRHCHEGVGWGWIHPGRLAWNLKISEVKKKTIFQTFIIVFQFVIQEWRELGWLDSLDLLVYR